MKHLKSILIVASVVAALVFFALTTIWTDRNYAPGSNWPFIIQGAGIVVLAALVIGWCILWFGPGNNKK